MDNEPDLVILLMYWSHDMRHTGFRKLMVVNRTSGIGASQAVVWICVRMRILGPDL